MEKRLYVAFLFFVMCLSGCDAPQEKAPTEIISQWQLVYRNDANGQHAYGDKQDLIKAIRKGYPIRVGWASRRAADTTKSVEHISDATFITIANQSEVFVQIEPFLAQRPDLTSDTLSMTPLPIQLSWLLGTNGTISSVDINYTENSSKTNPSRLFGRGTSWFIYGPSTFTNDSTEIVPLWD